MKHFFLVLVSLLFLSPFQAYAGHDINYECHPYYDNEGAFDKLEFENSLLLDFVDGGTEEKSNSKDIWIIFLLGVGGGLLALLTPCVFPMIPLTVSYFTKGSGNKKQGIFQAILYGFFIFLIYTLVSAPFYLLNLAPDVLNEIATNVWLNISFFIVFVVFAFSFFGFYEIELPSGLANKVSNAESTGGVLGTFFMALTLVIVSFSCTGPLVGSLLAGTLTDGPIYLTAGMAGFGIALGLPFALFALFPGMMSSLPKSGGWLNTVKVVLGFLELALALKFISNADLINPGLVIIKREIFLGIWILLSLLLAFYLFGWYTFKKGVKEAIGKGRIALGVIFLVISGLLVPSLLGKDIPFVRNVISGFPPPMQYSFFKEVSDNEENCIYDLSCEHDLFEAKCRAIEENKPILVDFTGYACVNCRRMEENVWIEDSIMMLLKDDFILASLYVDDRTDLPEEQLMEVSYGGFTKKLKTAGNKWSFVQIANFRQSTQPLYVVLTPTMDGVLMEPIGYTPDAKEYQRKLEDALLKFKEMQ